MVGFLGHTWIYASEMTHGVPLGSSYYQDESGWGLAKSESPVMWIEAWESESCDIGLTSAEGKGAGVQAQFHSQWFDQSCLCNDTPVKILYSDTQLSFLAGVTDLYAERMTHLEDIEDSCLAPRYFPIYFVIWLVLIFILYSKTSALSWILWVIPVNYQIKDSGNFHICS